MIDIASPEVIVPAVLGAVYGLGHVQDRRRRKRKGGFYKPSPLRPVKRFKRKIRGWHIKPLVTQTTIHDPETRVDRTVFTSRDRKNWVRVYPNPGYRIRGKHWCRGTHTSVIDWPEEA